MRIATNNLLMTIIACLITAGSTLCCQPCVNRASADPIILEKYIPYVHYKAKHVVQKITHNDIEDVRPVISGNNLAWERYADVSWCDDEGCHIIKDHQIMFRRGGVYPEKMVSSNTQFLVPGGPE